MTNQTMAQLHDEKAVKARLEQGKAGNQTFSYYCLTFTDSSNRRGSDRSWVNEQLLVNVANFMVALWGTKVFVAKTNKDRLEVILPGLNKQDAINTAGEMRKRLEEQFCNKSQGLGVGIGVASHPTDADEKHDVRYLAVLGADEATKLGQNRIFAAYTAAERSDG